MRFAGELKTYMELSTTPIDEIAAIFGVSERTLSYWRSGERQPHPRNLWPLRNVPDKALANIVRKELNRQLPGVFEEGK